ncbi:hypothetical protein D9M68_911070 [compost metagenome]
MFFQPFEIVPLRRCRRDQEEEILLQRHDRHFSNNPALVVGEIGKTDAPWLRHLAGGEAEQPVARALALQAVAGKTGKIENTGGVGDGEAFFLDAFLPRPRPVPGLGGFLRKIVARLGIPVGPLPTIIRFELRAKRGDPVVDRR